MLFSHARTEPSLASRQRLALAIHFRYTFVHSGAGQGVGGCARSAPGDVWTSWSGVWEHPGAVCAGLDADVGTPTIEE